MVKSVLFSFTVLFCAVVLTSCGSKSKTPQQMASQGNNDIANMKQNAKLLLDKQIAILVIPLYQMSSLDSDKMALDKMTPDQLNETDSQLRAFNSAANDFLRVCKSPGITCNETQTASRAIWICDCLIAEIKRLKAITHI